MHNNQMEYVFFTHKEKQMVQLISNYKKGRFIFQGILINLLIYLRVIVTWPYMTLTWPMLDKRINHIFSREHNKIIRNKYTDEMFLAS